MKLQFFLPALLLLQFTVNAQMKIGDNPTIYQQRIFT